MENHSSYPDSTLSEMFSHIKDALLRIESQTMRTNGRVTKLEWWQRIVIGGAITSFVLGGTIVGMGLYIYKMELQQISNSIDIKIKDNVQTALSNALSNYNIIVK